MAYMAHHFGAHANMVGDLWIAVFGGQLQREFDGRALVQVRENAPGQAQP